MTITPCLHECYKVPIVDSGGDDCMPDYRLAREVHAPNCPNAKPESILSAMARVTAEDNTTAPKPAALASCGCRDRVDIPHAMNCPENAKDVKPAEPQSEPPVDADGIAYACQHDQSETGTLSRAYLTLKAERARADKYEAESEQKGADLMAAESIVAEQTEEIERLKGDLQEAKHFSSMLTAALENRNEELKDLANRLKHRCFRYHIEDGVQLAKELAQVETLRAALAGVLPGIDEAWALWPEGRNAVLKARAAIAATEPKQ